MTPLLKKFTAIVMGSFLLSIGLNAFVIPNHLLDGGVIGLGLIVHYIWHVHTGLFMILFSIPIYILAWFLYRPFFYNSLNGLLFSSLLIDLLSPISRILHFPPLFSALCGGMLIGSGVGLMLRFQTSTGGTDLIAQLIAMKTRLHTGLIIFIIDGIIVSAGGILVNDDKLLFSALTIAVIGLMTVFLQNDTHTG